MPAELVIRVPIRTIPIVVDMKDPLASELTLDDFRKFHGKEPDQTQFKILSIEVITSPDDQQPMLVSECGKYARFLRREAGQVFFRKTIG